MAASKPRVGRCFAFTLIAAATIAPVGDHFHVVRGVTEYLTDFGPIWLGCCPLWFVLMIAPGMAALSAAHARWRAPDPVRASSAVLLGPLAVLGLYLATSFYPWRDGGSLEALIGVGALALTLTCDRTRTGVIAATLVAIGATAVELALVRLGVFRYLPGSDELFGVAPWLLPLYFGAAIVAGAIARRLR